MTLRLCQGCRRPKRVCLCAAYPQPPVETFGQVVILQHPLEERRTLATVPLLESSIKHCTVIRDRKFQVVKHPKLLQLLQQVANGLLTGYLLFPGPGSKDLTKVAAGCNECTRADCQSCSSCNDSSDSNRQCRMKQQSSFALGIESAHVQDEHKDLPGTSPSLQNGGIPIAPVSKSVPSHPANTPQFLENSHHTCASLSVVPVAAQDAISPQQASSNVHEQDSQSRRDQKKTCALPYVLFAIDGTWQEAKEIYKVESASAAFCLSANAEDHPSLTPNIAATSSAALCVMSTTADAQAVAPHFLHTASGILQVQLPPAAEGGKAWLLRTEPMAGFVTTAEAVARAVAILEGDEGDLLAKLLAPLKLMTQLQAQFNPSLRQRLERQCQ